jgi:hypothetical protein
MTSIFLFNQMKTPPIPLGLLYRAHLSVKAILFSGGLIKSTNIIGHACFKTDSFEKYIYRVKSGEWGFNQIQSDKQSQKQPKGQKFGRQTQ